MPAAPPPKPDRKLSVVALRQLARQHTAAAVAVLAEVATQGSSETSRVSAAMALLERGYGKSGTVLAGEGSRPPIVHYRIELIDGSNDQASVTHSQTAPEGCAGDQG